MRIIKLETEHSTVQLTQQVGKWQLISIKGTNPVSTQINKSNIVGGNGSVINSVRFNDRQITLILALNSPVETHRLQLYEALGTGENARLHYKTDLIDVYIDGIIEVNECDMNSNQVLMQITLTCPQPFFKSMSQVIEDSANYEHWLEFKDGYMEIIEDIAFSTVTFNNDIVIANDSQVEIGMIITINLLSSASNLVIHNDDEHFGIKGEFLGGDKIVINTNFGEESVYLYRGSEAINLLNDIMNDNTWMQLKRGSNYISYSGEGSDFINVHIEYVKEYKGV